MFLSFIKLAIYAAVLYLIYLVIAMAISGTPLAVLGIILVLVWSYLLVVEFNLMPKDRL